MAAAIFHGKSALAYHASGAVYSLFAQLIEWSCTLTADVAESTVMHASEFGKVREIGFLGGTAAITTKFIASDFPISEGAEYTIELWRDATSTSKGYSGHAICIGIDMGVDKDDVETATYNFQFIGAVTSTLSAS